MVQCLVLRVGAIHGLCSRTNIVRSRNGLAGLTPATAWGGTMEKKCSLILTQRFALLINNSLLLHVHKKNTSQPYPATPNHAYPQHPTTPNHTQPHTRPCCSSSAIDQIDPKTSIGSPDIIINGRSCSPSTCRATITTSPCITVDPGPLVNSYTCSLASPVACVYFVLARLMPAAVEVSTQAKHAGP